MTALPRPTNEKFRYLLVGAWNTLVGYFVFFVLYLWLVPRYHYLVIAIASHFLAVLNAWVCYRWLVFRSSASLLVEYFRFNLTSALLLVSQLGILWLLSDGMRLHPLIAQGVAVICSVIMSYFMHKHVSFR
jgi:putative flippase GtrA